MAKVRTLEVSKFRGISDKVEIDFTGNDGSLQSVLLLGDNGTGKSSIADAVEFCARGKVSRRGNAGNKTRREAQSFLVRGAPYSLLTLSDGSTYGRGARPINRSLKPLKRGQFVPGFSLCPVVLSRADIDVFWKVGATDRMRFFFDYLRDTSQHTGYVALEIERTEKQLNDLKAYVLRERINFARAAGLTVDEVPADSAPTFNAWYYKRYPPKTFQRRTRKGVKRAVVEAAGRPSVAVVDAKVALMEYLVREGQLKRRLATDLAKFQGKAPQVVSAELPEILQEISSEVSSDFAELAKLPHVTGINIAVDQLGESLDIRCALSTGDYVDPTQILSEGSLDLLALLILLSVAKACSRRGQEKFLVLDDVWQSVDGIHRTAILEYLFAARFKGWQFLITVHDRLWARRIEFNALKSGHNLKSLELREWSPTSGPRLIAHSLRAADQLEQLIMNAPPEALCGYAGRTLEELSDALSIAMRTSVSRSAGDRYTLEDLWPGVHSALGKAYIPSEIKDVATKVNKTYDARNTFGAHYNSWAQSMSSGEVREFAELVVSLYRSTHCTQCGKSLGLNSIGNKRVVGWSCSCPGNPSFAY
jgi:recombinational DNA repair ATPase RecF